MDYHKYTEPFDTVEEARRRRESLGESPALDGRWALQVYTPTSDTWVVWGRPRSLEGEGRMMRELRGRRWRYRVDCYW